MDSNRSKQQQIFYLLFIVTVISYGLFLTQTGFYWDDWPFVWIAKFLGPSEFIPAFYGSRPLLGPIFFVTTSLVPPVPLYWQIFALVIRFASAVLVWFMFQQVWPQHKQRALVVTLLFLVFPGYSQHWVAFTHINQEWIPFLFYLLSFCFTTKVLRDPAKYRQNTFYAILFLLGGVFPTEYFIGLEPLRLFFIWTIIAEEKSKLRQSLLETFKRWAPYFFTWLIYLTWLTYYYTIGSYDSYAVQVVRETPSVSEIALTLGEAIWKAGIYSWIQVVALTINNIMAPSSLLILACIGAFCVFFLYYLPKFGPTQNESNRLAISALLTGVAGISLGRLPSLAAGLPLTLQSSNDRFMISMMLAGSLFALGVVEFLVRNKRLQVFVFSVLIAFGMSQQIFNANIFRRDWEKQQEFFWQLAWRIPDLKPGTLLLTDELPLDYETDLSFSAPINWMYAPDYQRSNLPYSIIYTKIRLGGPTLPALNQDVNIKTFIRTVYFQGSIAQTVVFYMPKAGCLRVLSPELGDQITYARQSSYLVEAIPFSKENLILPYSDRLATLPFLTEPNHTWCYYYVKAELARHQKEWNQIVRLLNEADSSGYEPKDPFEWLVFIEAYGMTGNIEAAEELSEIAMRSDNRVRKGLCLVWNRIQISSPERDKVNLKIEGILQKYNCTG